MQELVRRYFWVVVVAAVIASAVFAAKATNHVVEGKFLADPARGPSVKPPAPAPNAGVATRSKNGQPLVDRNMFCASCLPPVEAVAATGPIDPNAVTLTGLPLSLIATHVAEPKEPEDKANFATVLNTGTQKQGAYWVGSTIPGAGPVVAVHYKFVDFTNTATGRRERISLTGEVPLPPPPVTTTVAAAPPADGDELTAAIDSGIRRIDDTTYEIDKSLVDKVLANPMAIAKGARVMPSSKNGEPNGFRLYAVRPNSVYSKLGFSNGDTIGGINGMQLTSMDKAMEMYAKLRDASSLQVEVTRRGKPVTLNYTIR
ncbi:MAG: type II secretion system protein GspC [Kofleriaceae bacterium]